MAPEKALTASPNVKGFEASLRFCFYRLPSTTLCALLSLVELWRLRSSCARMLNVLPIVDLLQLFIGQRGVFVPHSFSDVEVLQVLSHLAQTAPGVTWTLKSETDVLEAIQTYKLAMQTWQMCWESASSFGHPETWQISWGEVRRLAFCLESEDRTLLRASVNAFMSSLSENSPTVDHWIKCEILGWPSEFFAALHIYSTTFIGDDPDDQGLGIEICMETTLPEEDFRNPQNVTSTDRPWTTSERSYRYCCRMFPAVYCSCPMGYYVRCPCEFGKVLLHNSVYLDTTRRDAVNVTPGLYFHSFIDTLLRGDSVLCLLRNESRFALPDPELDSE